MFISREIGYDFLNKNGERNAENTDAIFYNCGGYALHTYSWYRPYSDNYDDYRDHIIDVMWECDFEKTVYYEKLLDEYERYMLKDFPDMRAVPQGYTPAPDEELIVFRIGIRDWLDHDFVTEMFMNDDMEDTDCCGSYDFDFHYLLYRGGMWFSKAGGCDVEEMFIFTLDDEEEIWDSIESYCYDSESRYYVRKI